MAAEQQVLALAADQDVAASAAVEDDILCDSEARAEVVREIRADEALDRDQAIAFRLAAMADDVAARGDGYENAPARVLVGARIVDGVDVIAAVHPVGALAAG